MDEPTTPTPEVPRRRAFMRAAPGLLLSPLAFVFGAPAALIVLPAALPVLKRLRPSAYACLAGIALCWLLSLAGLNPWVALVKAEALKRMENALGAPISAENFRADLMSGEMAFENVRCELPDDVGSLSASRIEIQAGYGFLLRAAMPVMTVRGLNAEFDPSGDKLQGYLRREGATGDAVIAIVGGRVLLRGAATSVELQLGSGNGVISRDSVDLNIGLTSATAMMLGKPFDVALRGGLSLRRAEHGLTIAAEMGFGSRDMLHGYLQGTLKPDGGALHITLDSLELEPVWSRYRKLDRLAGNLRGTAVLTGGLSDLRFDLNLQVREVSYFHRVAMSLDESRSFRIPDGLLAGAVTVREGRDWAFEELTLQSDDCTLSTGPRLSANGRGVLVLDGPLKALTGRLDAVVERGRVAEAIRWGPMGGASLADMKPNIVLLGEQFSGLDLRWEAEIQSLEIDCPPLYGVARGQLEGAFNKQAGRRNGAVRTGGELALDDGKFRFMGAEGEVEASLQFEPGRPASQAVLRGSLSGAAEDAELNARISGVLRRPALLFTGVTMAPDELGRRIFRAGEPPPGPVEMSARRAECSRLFGFMAASNGNPFFGRDGRHVFLGFSPD